MKGGLVHLHLEDCKERGLNMQFFLESKFYILIIVHTRTSALLCSKFYIFLFVQNTHFLRKQALPTTQHNWSEKLICYRLIIHVLFADLVSRPSNEFLHCDNNEPRRRRSLFTCHQEKKEKKKDPLEAFGEEVGGGGGFYPSPSPSPAAPPPPPLQPLQPP